MSHVCDYREGECDRCQDEAEIEMKRIVLAERGRWLVVHKDGTAHRYGRLSRARSHIRQLRQWCGERAHVRRYHRGMVEYRGGVLEVTDARWKP